MYLRLFFRCSWFKYRQCLWENLFCKELKSWKWTLQTQSRIAGSRPEGEEHTRQSTSNFWNLTNICNISSALCSSTRKHVLFPFHCLSVLQLGRLDGNITKPLTNIARCPAGCGHHISFTLHLRQSKVTDHDFWLFILAVVEQVLGLERRTSKMWFEYVSPVTMCVGWCVAFSTTLVTPYSNVIWFP